MYTVCPPTVQYNREQHTLHVFLTILLAKNVKYLILTKMQTPLFLAKYSFANDSEQKNTNKTLCIKTLLKFAAVFYNVIQRILAFVRLKSSDKKCL